ncbi:MAG: GTP-binding protein [Ruminococcaceae bacterium]|nr:GTP-binding protein [Oscillospiraceae bacterium]
MKTVIGILAHVDAGKTTLAEALLYRAGKIRNLGRVDHGDTAMDTHELEKERGITIFASEAVFKVGEASFSLLDTPGHVDFSAETERVLRVLDYAVLVISGIDGVQAHTRTLWKLLKLYRIPTLIFVTKMDFARREREEIMAELNKELSDLCFDYESPDRDEKIALCREDILEKFLESGAVSEGDLAELIKARLAYPCFFGSGLKLQGIDEFLELLPKITLPCEYPDSFSARVFKISRDGKGERLTHLKVTGGKLCVRDSIDGQKISQIRIYSGGKFESVNEAEAGEVCAVTGLADSYGGQGMGYERRAGRPYLEPVMSYTVKLPEGADPQLILPKFKLLEEEDPQLKFSWDSYLQQIHVSLMGEVQTEILRSIVKDRFDLDIDIGAGRVMYKETVKAKVEGVGHYEPLKHYAEVHLILEPLPRGSGLRFESNINEDTLARNWQRLIYVHLTEKQHLGVLTGSPITDMKISLAAGRAHQKHTEGGDFRQATYRAVRQGLMSAESILLEPYYSFCIEVPPEQIGRAINDIRARNGIFGAPEESGDMYRLSGRVPVTSFEGYAAELASYTGGRGRLSVEVEGYDVCHNSEKVITDMAYRAEADTENPCDSVFCAHGAGFNVKWNEVPEYMHIESCFAGERCVEKASLNHRNISISDKELEEIMLREFGPIKRRDYGIAAVRPLNKEEKRTETAKKDELLIVDGYNVIFAWEDLKAIADTDLEAARIKLTEILSNYCAFTGRETVLVFDAYLVPGGEGERFDKNGVHVVYTKERETADAYIERLINDIGKNYRVKVVTSDGMIQLSALRTGMLRVPASEFEKDVEAVYEKISSLITEINDTRSETIGEHCGWDNKNA